MHIARIIGATRTLGKTQGFEGLPIRDEFLHNNGVKTHVMISAWQPTPEELADLNAGASVLLSVMGMSAPESTPEADFLIVPRQPPVHLAVGGVPKLDGG
jgi:hypothetical protein